MAIQYSNRIKTKEKIKMKLMASNLKEKSEISYEGGCFCNAIKFTVTADTFWSMLCYCNSCTKISVSINRINYDHWRFKFPRRLAYHFIIL